MRILIVDEQPLFREALTNHLEAIYPGATVFEANTVAEAQGVLAMYSCFSLIILDVSVVGTIGLEWLIVLRKASQGSKLIVISCLDDPILAKEFLRQGADGYIAKSAAAGDVRNAIHLVLAGEVYISPSLLLQKNVFLKTDHPFDNQGGNGSTFIDTLLTSRQVEVFRLMAKGLTNKAISSQLHCSEGTVKLHVSAILKALSVKNRTEAVRLGLDKFEL